MWYFRRDFQPCKSITDDFLFSRSIHPFNQIEGMLHYEFLFLIKTTCVLFLKKKNLRIIFWSYIPLDLTHTIEIHVWERHLLASILLGFSKLLRFRHSSLCLLRIFYHKITLKIHAFQLVSLLYTYICRIIKPVGNLFNRTYWKVFAVLQSVARTQFDITE